MADEQQDEIVMTTAEIHITMGYNKDGEQLISGAFYDPDGEKPDFIQVMGMLKWAEYAYNRDSE